MGKSKDSLSWEGDELIACGGLWLPKVCDLDVEQFGNCFSNLHGRKCDTFKVVLDGTLRKVIWWKMSLLIVGGTRRFSKVPFKPFHDTKMSKSGCLVHLQRPRSSVLHLPELKENQDSRSWPERCDKINVAAAEPKDWGFLVDILGVTAAPQDHLRHESAHLCLQCK